MRFRTKILFTILIAGLIPALTILVSSVYLLDSTLQRVGASGLESSLELATGLLDETEAKFGEMMAAKLEKDIPWGDKGETRKWLRENQLDMVFKYDGDIPISCFIGESSYLSMPFDMKNLLGTGINRIGLSGNDFVIFSKTESEIIYGCGIKMSDGYNSRGRGLAIAVSAAAGLQNYKEFSLKLLVLVSAFGFAFVAIVSLLMSSIFSKRLVRPLNILREGASRIGAGDLDYIVEIKGNDEFTQLAGSFNKMTARIKENQAKLVESEKMAAWREVARRIAHEIKNPLTPIAVELYRLKQQTAGNEQTLKQIETVENLIKSLGDLAGHFSTFAKEPELKRIVCSIDDIIRESSKLYSNYDDVTIRLDIADDLPQLPLDPAMMTRAFNNLLKNSIEAGGSNIVIDINLTLIGDFINLIIKDNGPGFPDEKLKNIDRPYYTTKKSGTGLGMAVVKKIIEEHGGKIEFYNDNGAVAEISLPV